MLMIELVAASMLLFCMYSFTQKYILLSLLKQDHVVFSVNLVLPSASCLKAIQKLPYWLC